MPCRAGDSIDSVNYGGSPGSTVPGQGLLRPPDALTLRVAPQVVPISRIWQIVAEHALCAGITKRLPSVNRQRKTAAGAREQVSLVQVAAQLAQTVPLFRHLDALGDDLGLEVSA
jgi:hypothetical protein